MCERNSSLWQSRAHTQLTRVASADKIKTLTFEELDGDGCDHPGHAVIHEDDELKGGLLLHPTPDAELTAVAHRVEVGARLVACNCIEFSLEGFTSPVPLVL